MSDEKDQDQSPEEELDPQKLADEVAGGIEEASGDDSATEGEEDSQALADEWAAAMEEAGETEDEEPEPDPVKQVELDELQDEGRPGGNGDNPELEVILDIPVRISMEVGGY